MSMLNVLVAALTLRVSVVIAVNVSSEPNTTSTTTTWTQASTSFLRATTTRIDGTLGSSVVTSTSQITNVTGHCVGNDSRCSGKSQQLCSALSRQGAHCEWVSSTPDTIEGDCSGNDSRCSGSNPAACTRLASKGSDCWWKHSDGPEGTCLGHDSRCADSGTQMCDRLANEGADCKWRAAFSFSGYLLLEVSNATSFVHNPDVMDAMTSSIANITALPSEFISTNMDLDLGNQTRRLSTRRLSADGKVMLTYAGLVPGDAHPTPTGEEVSAALMSTSTGDFVVAFRNSFGDILGDDDFTVSVLSKSDVSLTIVDASGAQVTTTAQGIEMQNSSTENIENPDTLMREV